MSETAEAKRRRLSPLITPQGLAMIARMEAHPDAPKFNYVAGDQLHEEDLADLRATRPIPIVDRVARWLETVPLFRTYAVADPRSNWHAIPTTSREDLAKSPERLVPDDEPLDRMIIYRTSGTTGHPLHVPHHPRAAAAYQILIERALAARGIPFPVDHHTVGAFLLGAQRRTVTYPTALAAWRGAGFAKLNLAPDDWRAPGAAARYIRDHAPLLLTGDPITFARLLEDPPQYRPNALLSTAVAMSPALKTALEEEFHAPVLEWYSLTETGPLGCTVPGEDGYRLLCDDVLVETLDAEGRPTKPGERGEVVVTGGRNPYVPLLRYRTGDWGRLENDRLYDLEGRAPVALRTRRGRAVSPQDLAAVLRDHAVLQYEVRQRKDLTCEVRVRPLAASLDARTLHDQIAACFDDEVPISVHLDVRLGDDAPGGKVRAFASEVALDE